MGSEFQLTGQQDCLTYIRSMWRSSSRAIFCTNLRDLRPEFNTPESLPDDAYGAGGDGGDDDGSNASDGWLRC